MFLDYIACGRIDETRMHDIMRGIVRGCELAGCSLGGGETAEMPDLYGIDDFDLAGFAVGIAEKDAVLPRKAEIRAGDLVLGPPSSGIHSNGLSLARKVIPESDAAAWEEMLIPTRIYATEMKALIRQPGRSWRPRTSPAAACSGTCSGSSRTPWPRGSPSTGRCPPIFARIQAAGGVSDDGDALRVQPRHRDRDGRASRGQ